MKQFILISVVLLLLLAGCTQPPGQQQNRTADTAQEQQTGAQAGEDNSAQVQNNGGQSGDIFSQLTNALSLAPEYKASYTFSSSSTAQNFDGTYTWYFKGGKQRTDMTAQNVISRTWILPDKIVSCSKQSADAQENCFELTNLPEGSPQTLDAEQLRDNQNDYTVTPLPPKIVAGQTGNCYHIVVSTDSYQTNSDYCITSDGILLYIKSTTEQATWEMVATSITRGVSDADMTPPAAQSLTFPTGYGLPEGTELPEGFGGSNIPGYQ